MHVKWLLPFKGRNPSGKWDVNFVWQSDAIYIMDNHRAAAWCWANAIDNQRKYRLFHIDHHTDTLSANLPSWAEASPNLWEVTLEEYLAAECMFTTCPLFTYDNYLSIFLRKYKFLITHLAFATHNEGDRLDCCHTADHDLWDLPGNLDCLDQPGDPWIVNVDLDYFVCWPDDETAIRLVHDDYIATIATKLKDRLDSGTVAVLTIALSPEHCGGWAKAETLCEVFCAHLGVCFRLPA